MPKSIEKRRPASSFLKIAHKSTQILLLTLALTPCLALPALAQDAVPVVTGVPRVDKLLSQMTLDEKLALIRGASEPPATNQGQAGYLAEGSPGAVLGGRLEQRARSQTIFTFGGGTNEIQRDIISWLGLGLPRAPR